MTHKPHLNGTFSCVSLFEKGIKELRKQEVRSYKNSTNNQDNDGNPEHHLNETAIEKQSQRFLQIAHNTDCYRRPFMPTAITIDNHLN